MPGANLERYGLTGNPFRELSSETVEDIPLSHVNLGIDAALREIREEVFDKEGRAVVALVGGPGTGKTHRLRLAAAEAKERSALVVSFDLPENASGVVHGVAQEMARAARQKGVGGFLGSPAWLRPVTALAKSSKKSPAPAEAAQALGAALNATAPSVLLLNDLNHLVRKEEAGAWLETLETLADTVQPGVLVMFGCLPEYYRWISGNHPSLASRINRTFQLEGLKDDEAKLLIAKRMLPKRIVEDLDPTYPFDTEAVSVLNKSAEGNPRRLLALADLALEAAVSQRSYRVDEGIARSVVPAGSLPAGWSESDTAGPSGRAPDSSQGGAPPVGTSAKASG